MPIAIKHVVFDIGGVLLGYDVELPYRRLIPDEARRKWFLSEVCSVEWNIEQDKGRSWSDAEAVLIAQFPEEETLIRAFRQNWRETITHAHQDTVDSLLAMIDRGIDVTLLSNWSRDTFDEIVEHHKFLSKPRAATISGSVGMIKPDPAIFEYHSKTHGCKAEDSLFIDDNATNVKIARGLGWHAIHYVDHATLQRELGKYQFLD